MNRMQLLDRKAELQAELDVIEELLEGMAAAFATGPAGAVYVPEVAEALAEVARQYDILEEDLPRNTMQPWVILGEEEPVEELGAEDQRNRQVNIARGRMRLHLLGRINPVILERGNAEPRKFKAPYAVDYVGGGSLFADGVSYITVYDGTREEYVARVLAWRNDAIENGLHFAGDFELEDD